MIMPPHPMVIDAPYAAIWRRAGRKRFDPMPLAHAELVVLVGLTGNAQYLLDGRMHRLERGAVIWAPSGIRHMLVSESQDFDMWVVLAAAELWRDKPTVPIVHDQTRGGLRRLSRDIRYFDDLCRRVYAQDGSVVGDGLRWLIAELWHAFSQAPIRQGALLHSAVTQAVEQLEADPTLAVGDIAAATSLSESRLRQVFRKEMGESIGQFRRMRRLLVSDAAVAEGHDFLNAALAAGYGSYSQYFRDFVAVRGTSPRDWHRK